MPARMASRKSNAASFLFRDKARALKLAMVPELVTGRVRLV